MIVTLAEAKKYLRVDYDDEDSLIKSFIRTGEKLMKDTIRKEPDGTDTEKVAVLYAVAYLFENREDADMNVLTKSMRYILMTEREAAF